MSSYTPLGPPPQAALAIAGVRAGHAADVPRLVAAHDNEYLRPTR